MSGMFLRRPRWAWVALVAALVPFAMFTHLRGQQPGLQPGQVGEKVVVDNVEEVLSGLSVIPTYDGWHTNPDGTIDMWFSYHNQNWQEELDIPVGTDNFFEPFGPDAGQPTHFQPRTNRWTFKVRIPKDWDETKELVWTLTSRGKTYKAYGSLKLYFIQDDNGLQREAGVEEPPVTNKPPVVHIVGDEHRTAKVGAPIILSATCIDDGLPKYPEKGRDGKPRDPNDWRKPASQRAAYGLRMSWVVFRSPGHVTFDPPQFKTWEDQRGGSASARRWAPPPLPPDNLWAVRVTFSEPGEYVLQARGSDGLFFTNEYVKVTVAP
jgi:hypothetical protein